MTVVGAVQEEVVDDVCRIGGGGWLILPFGSAVNVVPALVVYLCRPESDRVRSRTKVQASAHKSIFYDRGQ